MPTELLSADLLHTRDAIDLPPPGEAVEAWAERRDTYPILVTRSLPETLAHLIDLIDDAHVAVITDRTVAELHGGELLRGLRDAGLEPEVVAIAAGERHKTLPQALELLDWLTGTQIAPA